MSAGQRFFDPREVRPAFRAPPLRLRAAELPRLRPPPALVRLRLDFVCPASRRCLFTVRAAISLARFVLLPCFRADSLMCSYCRFRFALFTPRGGMDTFLP